MSQTKVFTKLIQMDDYPPVGTESVWVTPVSGFYLVDNIPFYIDQFTTGDLIDADSDEDGNLWYTKTIKRSKNSLIRVVFFETNLIAEVMDKLKSLGCECEGFNAKLIAINVSAEVNYQIILDYLYSLFEQGISDFEEAIIRHK